MLHVAEHGSNALILRNGCMPVTLHKEMLSQTEREIPLPKLLLLILKITRA